MTAKIRLITRRFDFAAEGDTVENVERLLEIAKAKGLAPWTVPSGTGATEAEVMTENTQVTSMDASENFEDRQSRLLASDVSPLDEETAVTRGAPAALAPEVRLVTRRQDGVVLLSPKFPPQADGAERYDAASMVILAAYDMSGETPVTGSRLLKSLRNTGYNLDRADRALEVLRQRGLIMVEGQRKGRRYQLSEAGRTEARNLARELAELAGKSTPTEESP
jgi:DNA-binding transcriptional ArsR family regulator